MPETVPFIWLLLIGFVTGFFDSVIGAGGLVSVPSLIFLGLSPQVAIATDRFGTLGQSLTTFIRFRKAKKIVWKYVPVLAVLALFGSLIGAHILLNVDQKIFKSIIGVLILILLPLIFLRKDAGVRTIATNRRKTSIGLLIYFFVMIFAGFFGQGTGPLIFYALTFFLGLTMIEVLGTNVIPLFVLSLSSTILFGLNGIINYQIGIILLISMSIGSYVGAHVAIQKGNVWIKRLFVAFVIILGIKLLFF